MSYVCMCDRTPLSAPGHARDADRTRGGAEERVRAPSVAVHSPCGKLRWTLSCDFFARPNCNRSAQNTHEIPRPIAAPRGRGASRPRGAARSRFELHTRPHNRTPSTPLVRFQFHQVRGWRSLGSSNDTRHLAGPTQVIAESLISAGWGWRLRVCVAVGWVRPVQVSFVTGEIAELSTGPITQNHIWHLV